MPAKITIVNMYTKCKDLGAAVVNTTSKSPTNWMTDLSPFHLGPVKMYDPGDGEVLISQNFENCWQFAKVYETHADKDGEPTERYWEWAMEGFADKKPHRYPMGRGARPLYSLWNGKKLGYIDARKHIYGPLFAEAVQKTDGWKKLKKLYEQEEWIVLRDYDGYDHEKKDMSLTEVLNHSRKKMGHAFVLKMLLTGDPALKQLVFREDDE